MYPEIGGDSPRLKTNNIAAVKWEKSNNNPLGTSIYIESF
jgi:hypothetical protein